MPEASPLSPRLDLDAIRLIDLHAARTLKCNISKSLRIEPFKIYQQVSNSDAKQHTKFQVNPTVDLGLPTKTVLSGTIPPAIFEDL